MRNYISAFLTGLTTSSLTELLKSDSAVKEYVFRSSMPQPYAFSFDSLAEMREANARASTVLTKATVSALSERITATTTELSHWRAHNPVPSIDMILIVSSVLSVLADEGIDSSVDPLMHAALKSIANMESGSYSGIYYQSREDSDADDEAASP